MSDPGPLPEELLRVPGFISEVMDHCLATAPYPNVALAFCGALALQAFLARNDMAVWTAGLCLMSVMSRLMLGRLPCARVCV